MPDMGEKMFTYSRLSSQSVCRLIESNYTVAGPLRCKFYVRGLHDNYLIEGPGEKYIFRIYRNDWRTPEQVMFELELLAYVSDNGAPVAAMLRTAGGELACAVDSVEGQRQAALFNYADGIAPGNDIAAAECELLGNAVANIHSISQEFQTAYSRPLLEIPYLLDESITAIEPFIDAEAQTYLKTLQWRIRQKMPTLPKSPGLYGICIGDVNPTNFHINGDNRTTVFDFYQCGYGYRAFEIGKFISSLTAQKHKHELSRAFVDGYQQVRRLSSDEIRAIPLFEIISVIWVMAIHVYNVERIGYKLLEKPFWDRGLARVKNLESELETTS